MLGAVKCLWTHLAGKSNHSSISWADNHFLIGRYCNSLSDPVTLQSKVYSSQYPSTGFIVSRPICYAKSLQSCPSRCGPMDHNPPGSSVHGTLQARMLEWIAISCPITAVKPNHASEKITKSDHTKWTEILLIYIDKFLRNVDSNNFRSSGMKWTLTQTKVINMMYLS